MTRKRLAGVVACSAIALIGVLALCGALALRSQWFRERVRRRLVSAV